MTNPIGYSEVQKPRDLGSDLLAWAPAIANGSALVSLAGLIGNVDDPDAALKALTPTLALFGLGLIFALFSASAASRQIALEKERVSFHAIYEAASIRESEAAVATSSRLPSLESLKIINPAEAENQYRSIYRLLLERQATVSEWADKTRASSLKSIGQLTPKISFWGRVSMIFATVSIIVALAAFLVAVVGHSFGARLQPLADATSLQARINSAQSPTPPANPNPLGALNPRPSSALR